MRCVCVLTFPGAYHRLVHGPADIDQLYQLPLDEFTAARNALAKAPARARRTSARSSSRRSRRGRSTSCTGGTADVGRARRRGDNLRRVNKAVLSGGKGDVRAAGKAHDEAVQDALKATLELLEQAGQPATDATRQAIVTTLRALPADDPPGRLTRVLQPGGFEMLAGLSVGAPARKEGRDTKDAKEHAKETKESTKGHARGRRGETPRR